jgi:hypothetical protein
LVVSYRIGRSNKKILSKYEKLLVALNIVTQSQRFCTSKKQ